MKQETYRRIVSGKDRRLLIRVFRILLWVLGALYGVVLSIRNRLYDTGILKSYAVDVPVICVGNLTAGGTGKTPLVIWLCQYLSEKGLKCAILTRGYKTETGKMTDEPALLAKACGDVPVVVNSDRLSGARKAIEEHKADVLIMDDGFQHRRLKRDMDIVAIDATCPFGYGRILPAGYLRESPRSLKRAEAVVITRSDQVKPEQLHTIEKQIYNYNPDLPIAQTVHRHTSAVTFQNERIELSELKEKRVYAFCGIGNPDAFFLSLTQSGLNVVGAQAFDDHYAYTQEDMEQIFENAGKYNTGVVLCTEKDWVKSALLAPKTDDFVFATLAMELDFVEGFDKISGRLDKLVATVPS